MRLAIITTYPGAAGDGIEKLWSEAALGALCAGHQVLVSHGPEAAAACLDTLRQQGAQLQKRPQPSRRWAPKRGKQTRAALTAFAPHAVLVVQSAPYDVAGAEQAELRETLLNERLSFVLLSPAQHPVAPTAKLLRHARAIFSAAAICGFQSVAGCELVRSQLNVPLGQARILPWPDTDTAVAAPANRASASSPELLQWLQSIAGRRRSSDANDAHVSAQLASPLQPDNLLPDRLVPDRAVHMFWHGPRLSRLERLCMSSFIAHGHEVLLHVYQEPQGVPPGVQLKDANRVLSERYLFRHAKSGSVAAFADWFRYVLLHEQGGIWVDTDVVCLKPWRYPQSLVFGRQDEQIINNAVLGLPRHHELAAWMIDCCEFPNRARPYDKRRTRRRKLKRRLFQGNLRGNIAWGENGPLGFTQAARHLGYDYHALPFWHFYPVHFLNWHTVFDTGLHDNPHIIAGSNALHLWNEMVRRAPGFHAERRFDPTSVFEQLCARYLTNDS